MMELLNDIEICYQDASAMLSEEFRNPAFLHCGGVRLGRIDPMPFSSYRPSSKQNPQTHEGMKYS
jgi:hypothetical protein